MNLYEAENLKWALVHMNEAAYQVWVAITGQDEPDIIEDAQYEAKKTFGQFIGMAETYTAGQDTERAQKLLVLASTLHRRQAETGKAYIEYGAVEGAIQALTERTP